MTTITRERLTKILIETMALIKQRSSCTGDSSGISTEVNAELFAEITRMALASLDAVASYSEKLPCPVFLEPGLRFSKGVTTSIMLDALQRRAEYNAELDAMTPEQRAEHDAGIAEFKAMMGNDSRAAMLQAGNSPVTPDGWQLVPKEPTEAMNKAGWAAMNEHDAINPTYRAMLAAAPQQDVRLALEIGMSRYAGAMQKLADAGD
ncbi:hypothetical protein [Citrobacter portucalensis]|uniref:hypothetical protein n=1 Tax=Citrobacter portucalensis TaxID=1639133 RepID=UPI00396768C7